MMGQAPSHTDPSYLSTMEQPVIYNDPSKCRGMRFELRVRAVNMDGKVQANESSLRVNDATEVVLYLSAATSYNGFDKCPDKEGRDESELAESYLKGAVLKNFEMLKNDHIADYQQYSNRVSLVINSDHKANLPMTERAWDGNNFLDGITRWFICGHPWQKYPSPQKHLILLQTIRQMSVGTSD